MTRFSIALLALMFAVGSAEARSYSPEELARRAQERRAVEAVDLGHARGQHGAHVRRDAEGRRQAGQVIYWGKPLDWHNQTLTPNPDTLYFMGFYDFEGVRPDGGRDSAGRRRRLAQRQFRHALADGARRRRPARRRQGQGGQVRHHAPGLCRDDSAGLRAARIGHLWRLLPHPLEPEKSRRRRRADIDRLRQAGEILFAVRDRQSAGDDLHRRQG